MNLTPAALRILENARRLAAGHSCVDTWAGLLLLSLLQDESLASAALARHHVTADWLRHGGAGPVVARSAGCPPESPIRVSAADAVGPSIVSGTASTVSAASGGAAPRGAIHDEPDGFRCIIDRAVFLCRRAMTDEGVSSSHLLLALLQVNPTIRDMLAHKGATEAAIRDVLSDVSLDQEEVLPVDFSLGEHPATAATVDASQTQCSAGTAGRDAGDTVIVRAFHGAYEERIWRVLDATLNRAREGLRVLEDHARFMDNNAELSRRLKELRHRLLVAEHASLHRSITAASTQSNSHRGNALLNSRNTPEDVGTRITTATEQSRMAPADIVRANCRRVQEALRSLEEFGKLVSPEFAAVARQLRYEAYDVEQQLLLSLCRDDDVRARRLDRLQRARLYVLVTESACRLPWKVFAEQSLAAGVDIVQLREKQLSDAELLRRARWLVDATRAAPGSPLCIINDRPEIAVLSQADGVHVGQDELSPEEAVRILSPGQLLGLSTHTPQQIIAAQRGRVDYVGIGPVFASGTKSFSEFPGLDLVSTAAAMCGCPWFAIGGISEHNLPQVLDAGATRIAVTAAVADSPEPAQRVRAILDVLLSR